LPSKLFLLGILIEGVLFLLALFLARTFHISLSARADFSWAFVFYGAAASLPPLFFFRWLVRSAASSLPLIRSLRHVIDTLLKPFFSPMPVHEMLLLSIAAGLGEEIFFRGVLQPAIGLLLSSLLFGLLHAINLGYALYATLMGLYLGVLYYASGGLVLPIVTHALYDFGALVSLRYFDTKG
jgi:membrane protease YdiL (CAAX protease family)